ncbi:maltose/maltodextrin transport ATP-binding protein malk [Brucella melitensis bv. 1 str. 16M]|uniref:Maltose/maltodextrin transport ATP-binding protein malk n=1 Tax=Brucella melitensis biotype 1 (strain ATCC 23456 / CCUG 17765 / NCTC 10094 / 16M) TaxID=224914 RepID=Q8YBF9_BRUME|nr:maltose/maltodextrin transport ATP-binding protein malk [Brucella melitensis bv. 1 str. 16M]
MAELQLRDVRKSFGSFEVIKGVDMDIRPGEFMVFVGPSGCGKSTLLRLIAGLEEITSGTLSIDGTVVNSFNPSRRGIAMVFQSYALYPHMTVYENMAFGMQLAGKSRQECKAAFMPPPKCCSLRLIWSACRASFPAGSASASPSAAPLCVIRRCSFSMSPCPISMRRCVWRQGLRSPGFTRAWKTPP